MWKGSFGAISLFAASIALTTGCAQQPGDISSAESSGQVDESQAVTLRTARVELAAQHDTSAPLFLIDPKDHLPRAEHEPKRLPMGPAGHFASVPAAQVQTSITPLAMPVTQLNFDGVGAGFSGPAGVFSVASAPPDTNGDVGPNHYVQTVNTDFAVFNKSGAAVYGPVAINTIWSGFGGGCETNNDGDPTVVYDPMADRFVISQFSVSSTPYMQCVAVSATPDPTGAYHRYAFSYGNTDFTDYPKIGVWPDAYYTTFNVFANGANFSGAKVCAYDRSKMLTGAAATQQCFSTDSTWGGLLPADLDGSRQPPAGSPEYVVAFGTNNLGVWKFHVDWTTPANSTFTGPTLLAVSAFSPACGGGGTCIPQAGTSQQLDSLADRLMYRLAYRNFGSHESLVTNHSVTAGTSVGVRWYELRADASHNLSVFQQGTYAPDANYRWMGSVAMDQSGNMALGFSLGGASLNPEIHYTGRLASDAAGTMTQGESTIINGGGVQSGTQGLTRWGDYSMMGVDPSDDCTFWYTTEYIPSVGEFNWKTRIGSFKFPGCGGTVTNDFSIGASPSSLTINTNASGNSTISTAVTSGSAQTVALSVSGLPSGATASFNPASVTAGSSSTLTINTGTAATGSYTLTVTGTGASATHATSVSLNIGTAVANNFKLYSSPASLTLPQGTSGTDTLTTRVVSGTPETVTMTVFSGLPSGATASFNPPSFLAGGKSILTINAGTAKTGTYNLIIAGTSPSIRHGAPITLIVTAPVTGGGIVNGGFETGSLSGWTASGSTGVATVPHSGTYSALVGSTSPSGDSAIAQTFTAPSGTTKLSLYYANNCPDTITYDWVIITLKDNTTGVTSTLLPATCAFAYQWTLLSGAVTAGHSYTLTIANHDDDYPGDPTYTLVDDVTLQ
jgi:hypothetical protein